MTPATSRPGAPPGVLARLTGLAGLRFALLAAALIALLAGSFVLQLDLLSGPFSLTIFLWLVALGLPSAALILLLDRPGCAMPPWLVVTRARLPWLNYGAAGAALLCAALAAWEVQTDGSQTLAVIGWAVAIVLVLAAPCAWPNGAVARGALRDRLAAWRTWRWWALALTAILVLGAVLRLVDLGTIPGFVHNDEANDGLQARSIMQGQVPSIFSISLWSQLPMLVHTWYALFLWLFGDSLVSQRLGSVVLGLLSILLTALLGREMFGWRAGLIAATMLAVYHFSIHFSRVGIQVISGDVAVPLTLYLLMRALRYGSRPAAVGTGIALTLDLHAYFGSRIMFVVAPTFIVLLLLTPQRRLVVERLRLIGWALLGLVVSLAPMGVYILHHWDLFTQHTMHETILSNAPDIQTQLTGAFGTHDFVYMFRTEFWRTLQTLFYSGDGGEQYGIDRPLLDPLSSALLTASAAYALLRVRQPGFLLLLLSILSTLIIGGALTINMPYWPRLIVLAPLLALLIGAFLDAVWHALEQRRLLAIPAAIGALALLGVIANGNYQWYFRYFTPRWRVRFIAAPLDVANYLRAAHGISLAYGISDGSFYINSEVIRFVAPGIPTCTMINKLDFTQCPPVPKGRVVFFIFPGSEQVIPTVERAYPHGSMQRLHTYDLGQSIYIYTINT